MRLTNYTDYSVRVLVYLALHPGRYVSTEEISSSYAISNNHLVKVVNNLGRNGFIHVKRGRNGGIILSRAPEKINVGDVIRTAEPDFVIAECFQESSNECPITEVCGLKHVLQEAHQAFMKTLNRYTLSDLLKRTSSVDLLRAALEEEYAKSPRAVSLAQKEGAPQAASIPLGISV